MFTSSLPRTVNPRMSIEFKRKKKLVQSKQSKTQKYKNITRIEENDCLQASQFRFVDVQAFHFHA